MSGTTIGQAYVQILPSMNGMAAAINRSGGPVVSSSGKSLGGKLGSGMAATATKILAAAGIGTALASSINEGGKLQQSLGGVETLFGNAAKTVKKNAANAWKTVGMSANKYMEQTTSFAASLVSSLGRDTGQAAKLADVAMRDMSDNANKMGTDMTNITNAYQGFAKQNYTMLDNLKLGYGGTKTEMQRLIADASKMTDVQNKLGISVDGTSLSYDNIVKAIHVVQSKMGVMGTTSKEAATTLTGSVSMMKSSWTDFLGRLSLGGDMTQPLKNLINSVVTFGANIAPLLANIVTGIGNLITSTDWGSIVDGAMDSLDTTVKKRIASFNFSSTLSSAFSTLGNIGGSLADSGSMGLDLVNMISDSLGNADWGTIASTIGEKLSTMVSLGSEGLTGLVDTGVNLVENIGQGMETAIPELLDKALPMLSDLSETIRENAGKLIDCGLDLITNIADGLIDSIPTLVENVPTIVENMAGIINDNAPKLLITGAVLLGKLAEGIIKAIPTIVANLPKIITAIASVLTAFNWINLGKSIVTGIANGVKALPEKISGFTKSAVGKLKDILSNGAKTAMEKFKNLLVSGAKGTANAFKGGMNGIVTSVKTIFSKMVSTAKNAIVSFKNTVVSGARTAMSRFKSTLSGGGKAAATALKNGISKIPSIVKSILSKAWNIIKGIVSKFKGAFKFSWSLPHLKVPHVSVSGGKAPFGIGGKGSLPHFNVSWYKKAMENPYVFSDATLFGAGEAGDEMLYGRSKLMSDIREATQGTKNDVTINVTVNGADNPEEWGKRMASELRRQVKMA